MAENSPEEAVDAFIAPLRRALACVVRGTAIASGAELDEDDAVTLFPEGKNGGDPARLRTHGGEGELLFRFAHQYRVVRPPDDAGRGRYLVDTSFYRYDLLDRDGGEVVVFHWEPEGRSPVRTPHLHVSAALPVVLPQRVNSRVAATKTYLNKMHLPTGHIQLEDIVELLIREFAVVPLVQDWEAVVAENRAAHRRRQTW